MHHKQAVTATSWGLNILFRQHMHAKRPSSYMAIQLLGDLDTPEIRAGVTLNRTDSEWKLFILVRATRALSDPLAGEDILRRRDNSPRRVSISRVRYQP